MNEIFLNRVKNTVQLFMELGKRTTGVLFLWFMYLLGELMGLFSWILIIHKCPLPHVDINKKLSDEFSE